VHKCWVLCGIGGCKPPGSFDARTATMSHTYRRAGMLITAEGDMRGAKVMRQKRARVHRPQYCKRAEA
jgi:hypothetical protein